MNVWWGSEHWDPPPLRAYAESRSIPRCIGIQVICKPGFAPDVATAVLAVADRFDGI